MDSALMRKIHDAPAFSPSSRRLLTLYAENFA